MQNFLFWAWRRLRTEKSSREFRASNQVDEAKFPNWLRKETSGVRAHIQIAQYLLPLSKQFDQQNRVHHAGFSFN
jgi:hypothetical protein